jgi:hypothetical protein
VDPRQRWQALQSHLNAARSRFDAGDRAAALREVDAALALDPEFLAALTLRERITGATCLPRRKPDSIIEQTASVQPPAASVQAPTVSVEGWARFEQRARQRRMERRLAAARSSIGRGRLDEARLAMAEVRGLDPHHPELIALGMELEAAEHTRPWRFRFGPSLAAAAAFSAIVLGASWLENTTGLLSYPIGHIAGLAPEISPSALTNLIGEVMPSVGTIGSPDQSPDAAPRRSDVPAPTTAADVSASVVLPRTPPATLPSQEPPAPQGPTPAAIAVDSPIAPASVSAALLPLPAAPPPPATPSEPAAAVSTVSLAAVTMAAMPIPASAAVDVIDEEGLVRRTLQRYRAAYEGLDARSAHEVWPAVNQSALARAFDGLQSQRLNFETCDVELAGPAARAVCRGSARYVPKIGSREPRVEPRVWNFTLKKAGDDWQIENARAER